MVGRGNGKGWWEGVMGRDGGRGGEKRWWGTGMVYLLTQGDVKDFLWQ